MARIDSRFFRIAKVLLFILVSYLSVGAFGTLDLNYGAAARSRTPSLLAYSEVGWGQLLWGDLESGNETSSFLYGYVRPSLKVQTSAIVNSVAPRITLAPVAPFELSVGEELYHSVANSGVYSNACADNTECQGTTRRPFLSIAMKFAYGFWKGFFEAQRSFLRHQKGDVRYLHVPTDLIANGPMTMHSFIGLLGYRFAPWWDFALLRWSDVLLDTGDSSKFTGAQLIRQQEAWTFSIGIGSYAVSSLVLSNEGRTDGLSIVAEIKHAFQKGLVL